MGSMMLSIFVQFFLPVLVRQGVTIVTTALAAHGVAIGSTGETATGVILAAASAGYSAWRGSPDNLLQRAAAHPDPAAAALVQDALQKRAEGNGQPQI